MKSVLFISLLLIFQTTHANENNCNDWQTNEFWNKLAINHSESNSVINLVKLREQLCRQIETGEISLEKASKTFERERAWVDVEGIKEGKF